MSTTPEWPPITMTTGLDGAITVEIAGSRHAIIPPGPRARYDAVASVAHVAQILARESVTATAIDQDGSIYTLIIDRDGHATDPNEPAAAGSADTDTPASAASAGSAGRGTPDASSHPEPTPAPEVASMQQAEAPRHALMPTSAPEEAAPTSAVQTDSDHTVAPGSDDTNGTAGTAGSVGASSAWLRETAPLVEVPAVAVLGDSAAGTDSAALPVEDPAAGESLRPAQEQTEAAVPLIAAREMTVHQEARPTSIVRSMEDVEWERGRLPEREAASWATRAMRSAAIAVATLVVFCAGLAVGVLVISQADPMSTTPASNSGPAPVVVEDPVQSGVDAEQSDAQSDAQSGQAGDADPKADEGDEPAEPDASAPVPEPVVAPTPQPAPAPAPSGATSLSTSVSSNGGGAATFTVRVQGSGSVPVNVSVGGASTTITVNAPGSASVTLTPGAGRQSWSTSAGGITNNGSLTVY